MDNLSIGQVILARFSFSGLTSQKLRPYLIIGLAEFDDVILCQITSRPDGSKRTVLLSKDDFENGSIVIESFIRPDKIATLDQSLIVQKLGTLSTNKLSEVKLALKKVLKI